MNKHAGAIPFGISSHGRGLPDVDGETFIVSRSAGSRLIDLNNRSYVDYCMAMGANLVGHAHPAVCEACAKALGDGPLPGFMHPREEEAARALAEVGGRMSRVTFTSTGSEAVHLACRIARAATGRQLVAKAVGGYDGWYDEIRFGLVDSPECYPANKRPRNQDLTLLRVNDLSDLDLLFQDHGDDLAAVIVEPVLGNAGCLVPDPEFFNQLNGLARKHGVLVIADEVMVGLRLGLRPVSEQLGLVPDLMTMGKAIGSGLPVAAVLGTPQVFRVVESGEVVCYGTYQGNPVVTAAVSATLDLLTRSDFTALFAYGERLRATIVDAFSAEGIQATTSGISSVFSLWFAEAPPRDYSQALDLVRREATQLVYEQLRREGVVTLPTPWGRLFFSFAHGEEELEISARAFRSAAALLRESRLLETAS